MVISHRHRYLFIQVPHTASTAIAAELCELYGGQAILHKHATYADFRRVATTEEASFAVLAGIRNPLEMAVTKYAKRQSDHGAMFTAKAAELKRSRLGRKHLREFNFVQSRHADFASFFRRFYRLVYNDLAGGLPAAVRLIRHEDLQAEFAAVLDGLDIERQRPLPVVNPTRKDARDLDEYFTPEVRRRAWRVFSPYMARWAYEFPPHWQAPSTPVSSRVLFAVDTALRRGYYRLRAGKLGP